MAITDMMTVPMDMGWTGQQDIIPFEETHEILGHSVPIDVNEDVLTHIGSCAILDAYGDDPTDGEGISAMPADEVAEFVAYAVAHNAGNLKACMISKGALANTIAMARIWRSDHRDATERLLRHAEQEKLPSRMMGERSRAIKRMRARLDDPRAWSLWEVTAGECLDFETEETPDGREMTLVDGGPYTLTRKGENLVGMRDGVVPLWGIMIDGEKTDPYDCDDWFREVSLASLIDEGLVYDRDDESF